MNLSLVIDINECAINNGGCSNTCDNTRGSFQCDCPTGFVLDVISRKNCSDVDECITGQSGCIPVVQRCINLQGSFRCESKYNIWREKTVNLFDL